MDFAILKERKKNIQFYLESCSDKKDKKSDKKIDK